MGTGESWVKSFAYCSSHSSTHTKRREKCSTRKRSKNSIDFFRSVSFSLKKFELAPVLLAPPLSMTSLAPPSSHGPPRSIPHCLTTWVRSTGPVRTALITALPISAFRWTSAVRTDYRTGNLYVPVDLCELHWLPHWRSQRNVSALKLIELRLKLIELNWVG